MNVLKCNGTCIMAQVLNKVLSFCHHRANESGARKQTFIQQHMLVEPSGRKKSTMKLILPFSLRSFETLY